MKQLKLLTILMLLAMSLVCFAACGDGAEQGGEVAGGDDGEKVENVLNIVYCNTDTEARSTIQAGYWLEEYVESESNGAITVDVYCNNVLGDDAEVLKGMKLGTTANVFSGMGVIGEIVGTPGALCDLPFVHTSYEDWYNGMYNLGGLDIYNSVMEGSGYVCYDLQYAGAKHITSATQNYTSLDEMKGFKIRCTNNEMNLILWTTLGMNPTPVAWGELYTALQQGTVDGMEHSLGIIVDQRFYEPNPYITLTYHTWCPYGAFYTEDWFNSIPAEWQDFVYDALKQSTMVQHEMELDDEANKWMATLEENGVSVTEMPEETLDEMRALSEAVYDFMREECGAEVVDAYIATGGQV